MEHSEFFVRLRNLFEKLPGIGPRQANRFIWALLDFNEKELKHFGEAVLEISKRMRRCNVCFRVFPLQDSETTCSFCADASKRDRDAIMVVEHDSDLLNVEKSCMYRGLYHVLGDVLDPLDENKIVRERIKALYERLARVPGKRLDLKERATIEIILALSPTKMGEFTSEYIKKVLEPLLSNPTVKLKVTRLGRGLSTGVELEYADELTLKQAIDNRK